MRVLRRDFSLVLGGGFSNVGRVIWGVDDEFAKFSSRRGGTSSSAIVSFAVRGSSWSSIGISVGVTVVVVIAAAAAAISTTGAILSIFGMNCTVMTKK